MAEPRSQVTSKPSNPDREVRNEQSQSYDPSSPTQEPSPGVEHPDMWKNKPGSTAAAAAAYAGSPLFPVAKDANKPIGYIPGSKAFGSALMNVCKDYGEDLSLSDVPLSLRQAATNSRQNTTASNMSMPPNNSMPSVNTTNTNIPNVMASNVNMPNMIASNTRKPDLMVSNMTMPNVPMASNASMSNVMASNMHMPGMMSSNMSNPNVLASNMSMPNMLASSMSSPNVLASNTSIPSVLTSNMCMPNVMASNSSMPNVMASNANIPNIMAMNTTLPNMMPNVGLANMLASNPSMPSMLAASIMAQGNPELLMANTNMMVPPPMIMPSPLVVNNPGVMTPQGAMIRSGFVPGPPGIVRPGFGVQPSILPNALPQPMPRAQFPAPGMVTNTGRIPAPGPLRAPQPSNPNMKRPPKKDPKDKEAFFWNMIKHKANKKERLEGKDNHGNMKVIEEKLGHLRNVIAEAEKKLDPPKESSEERFDMARGIWIPGEKKSMKDSTRSRNREEDDLYYEERDRELGRDRAKKKDGGRNRRSKSVEHKPEDKRGYHEASASSDDRRKGYDRNMDKDSTHRYGDHHRDTRSRSVEHKTGDKRSYRDEYSPSSDRRREYDRDVDKYTDYRRDDDKHYDDDRSDRKDDRSAQYAERKYDDDGHDHHRDERYGSKVDDPQSIDERRRDEYRETPNHRSSSKDIYHDRNPSRSPSNENRRYSSRDELFLDDHHSKSRSDEMRSNADRSQDKRDTGRSKDEHSRASDSHHLSRRDDDNYSSRKRETEKESITVDLTSGSRKVYCADKAMDAISSDGDYDDHNRERSSKIDRLDHTNNKGRGSAYYDDVSDEENKPGQTRSRDYHKEGGRRDRSRSRDHHSSRGSDHDKSRADRKADKAYDYYDLYGKHNESKSSAGEHGDYPTEAKGHLYMDGKNYEAKDMLNSGSGRPGRNSDLVEKSYRRDERSRDQDATRDRHDEQSSDRDGTRDHRDERSRDQDRTKDRRDEQSHDRDGTRDRRDEGNHDQDRSRDRRDELSHDRDGIRDRHDEQSSDRNRTRDHADERSHDRDRTRDRTDERSHDRDKTSERRDERSRDRDKTSDRRDERSRDQDRTRDRRDERSHDRGKRDHRDERSSHQDEKHNRKDSKPRHNPSKTSQISVEKRQKGGSILDELMSIVAPTAKTTNEKPEAVLPSVVSGPSARKVEVLRRNIVDLKCVDEQSKNIVGNWANLQNLVAMKSSATTPMVQKGIPNSRCLISLTASPVQSEAETEAEKVKNQTSKTSTTVPSQINTKSSSTKPLHATNKPIAPSRHLQSKQVQAPVQQHKSSAVQPQQAKPGTKPSPLTKPGAALPQKPGTQLKQIKPADLQAPKAKPGSIQTSTTQRDIIKVQKSNAGGIQTTKAHLDSAKTQQPKTSGVQTPKAQLDCIKMQQPKTVGIQIPKTKLDSVKTQQPKTTGMQTPKAHLDSVKTQQPKTGDIQPQKSGSMQSQQSKPSVAQTQSKPTSAELAQKAKSGTIQQPLPALSIAKPSPVVSTISPLAKPTKAVPLHPTQQKNLIEVKLAYTNREPGMSKQAAHHSSLIQVPLTGAPVKTGQKSCTIDEQKIQDKIDAARILLMPPAQKSATSDQQKQESKVPLKHKAVSSDQQKQQDKIEAARQLIMPQKPQAPKGVVSAADDRLIHRLVPPKQQTSIVPPPSKTKPLESRSDLKPSTHNEKGVSAKQQATKSLSSSSVTTGQKSVALSGVSHRTDKLKPDEKQQKYIDQSTKKGRSGTDQADTGGFTDLRDFLAKTRGETKPVDRDLRIELQIGDRDHRKDDQSSFRDVRSEEPTHSMSGRDYTYNRVSRVDSEQSRASEDHRNVEQSGGRYQQESRKREYPRESSVTGSLRDDDREEEYPRKQSRYDDMDLRNLDRDFRVAHGQKRHRDPFASDDDDTEPAEALPHEQQYQDEDYRAAFTDTDYRRRPVEVEGTSSWQDTQDQDHRRPQLDRGDRDHRHQGTDWEERRRFEDERVTRRYDGDERRERGMEVDDPWSNDGTLVVEDPATAPLEVSVV